MYSGNLLVQIKKVGGIAGGKYGVLWKWLYFVNKNQKPSRFFNTYTINSCHIYPSYILHQFNISVSHPYLFFLLLNSLIFHKFVCHGLSNGCGTAECTFYKKHQVVSYKWAWRIEPIKPLKFTLLSCQHIWCKFSLLMLGFQDLSVD